MKSTPNENNATQKNRQYEYIEHSQEFALFITETLLPALQADKHLNISQQPEDTYLTGFSMAGHFAAETGLHHANKINNIICLSGAFNNKNADLITQCKTTAPCSLNVYLSIGTFENRPPDKHAQNTENLANMSRLEANKRLYASLQGKVSSIKLAEFPVGHSELTTLPAIGNAVSFFQAQKKLQINSDKKSLLQSQSFFLPAKEEEHTKQLAKKNTPPIP